MEINNNKAHFDPNDEVEVYVTNDAIHIRKIGYSLPKTRSNIKNLKNGLYMTKNGEVKKQRQSKKKIDNPISINRSFKNLRRVVESAVSNADNKALLSITLTYKNDCTDTDQLQHDFDIFLKRLRRYVKSHFNNAFFSYIKVFEPYENPDEHNKPRWHIHLLTIGLYYIDRNIVAKLWKQGGPNSVLVKPLKDRDPLSVAMYYTGYINTDEDLPEKTKSIAKRISKKQRLEMYPRNFAIYSTSRSIKPVRWHKVKMQDIIDKYPDAYVINSAGRDVKNNNKRVNRYDYLNLMKANSRFVRKEYKKFDIKEFK